MRDYFLGLVTELVAASHPDGGRWGRLIDELRRSASSSEPLIGERGIFGLLANEEQVAVLDRVQALMSVLEGHGHVIMDRLGERELVSSARMSDLLKQRRQDPRTAAFYRLTGLEMKLRQYAEGERFVVGVEDLAGWEALDMLWQGPESLPTLEEIREPRLWLSRVG
jgi:putative hydrolase